MRINLCGWVVSCSTFILGTHTCYVGIIINTRYHLVPVVEYWKEYAPGCCSKKFVPNYKGLPFKFSLNIKAHMSVLFS